MRYGYFDNERREYVIDRVDLPASWTNYIGTGEMYGVFNHTAGGYLLYRDQYLGPVSERDQRPVLALYLLHRGGRAHHPFMTGSAGWAYFAATQYILGVRPDFDGLAVDPCVPAGWREFTVTRKWRGGTYIIHVTNPDGVEKGVAAMTADGAPAKLLPVLSAGGVCHAEVVMG